MLTRCWRSDLKSGRLASNVERRLSRSESASWGLSEITGGLYTSDAWSVGLSEAEGCRSYTPATVRLVEVRLLDGPNLYRLEPAVRIEVTVGRRRTWYGERIPPKHALVRLGDVVPKAKAPRSVVELADHVRSLHARGL